MEQGDVKTWADLLKNWKAHQPERSQQQQIGFARARAMNYLDSGAKPADALVSFMSDLAKHPRTEGNQKIMAALGFTELAAQRSFVGIVGGVKDVLDNTDARQWRARLEAFRLDDPAELVVQIAPRLHAGLVCVDVTFAAIGHPPRSMGELYFPIETTKDGMQMYLWFGLLVCQACHDYARFIDLVIHDFPEGQAAPE